VEQLVARRAHNQNLKGYNAFIFNHLQVAF